MRFGDDHIDLQIRLTPNASTDQIIGIVQTGDNEFRLGVKVRAVPEKGKANKAVEIFLAKKLAMPKSAFSIVAGSTSRLKTLRIYSEGEMVAGKLALLMS